MRTKEVKHILGDGTERHYVRLFADEGRVLTRDRGATVWTCVDVLPNDIALWTEIEEPEEVASDV